MMNTARAGSWTNRSTRPPRRSCTSGGVPQSDTRDTLLGKRGVNPDHAPVAASCAAGFAAALHRELEVLNQSQHMLSGPGRKIGMAWCCGTAVAGQAGSEQFSVLVDAEQGRPVDVEQFLHRRVQIFRGADPDPGRAALPGELGPVRVPQRGVPQGVVAATCSFEIFPRLLLS